MDAASDGDMRTEAGFVAAYRRHAPELSTYFVRRTLDPEVSMDLLAETFAQAWQQRRRYRPDIGTPGGWLQGIANRQLLHYWRRERVANKARRRLGVADVSYEPDELADIERRCDAEARNDELAQSLAQLRPSELHIVQLRVVDQLPYSEVAAAVGCSEGTARVRVSRALHRLQDQLARPAF